MDNTKMNIIDKLDFNLFCDITIDNFKSSYTFSSDEQICEFGVSPTCLYSLYDNMKYAVYKGFIICIYKEDSKPYVSVMGDYSSPILSDVLTELIRKTGSLNMKYVSDSKRNKLHEVLSGYNISESTDENQYDYIYKISDFINLNGRINRHKREHYNYFINNCNFRYEEISEKNINDCITITKSWCMRKDCNECEFCCEKDIIVNLINDWNKYPMKGGIIYIDDIPSAFLMAEPFYDTVMGYHQKTISSDIRGLGYAIYIEAMKATFNSYKYFNIGPDIGIEGLRQFKRSFKPYNLIRKWEITVFPKSE